MNEFTKTLLFVGVAAVAVVGTLVGRPGRVGVEVPDQIGMPLFPEFSDPAAAESLEVVEFDELENDIKSFEVARKNGVWVIPSHENYAADATDNLKAAANMFIDLEVLNVAGDKNSSHATFGVVEPISANLDDGADAIGKSVKLRDAKGKRLVEVIVGKEVKGQEQQRYVRIANQDRVYTVSLDPSKLSTKFSDWIEQDVLQLNPLDIQDMVIRDYTGTPVMTNDGLDFEIKDQLRLRVRWNADEFRWDLVELLEAPSGTLRPTDLLDGETLDKSKLDAMKNALAGLEIVDVSPKPAALRDGLSEGQQEFWRDEESARSLITRGFYPPRRGSKLSISANSGEVTAITKDGVDITLSFGQIAGADNEDQEKLNRFVIITASIDEASLPRPILEPMPSDPAGPAAPETKRTNEGSDAAESEDADGSENIPPESDPPESDPPESSEPKSDAGAAEVDEAEAERDRIAKANQRKLDEYEEKRKKAQSKVDELNLRFADWYYVIDEDVYKSIHLSRVDVIQKDETKLDEGTGIDAFRRLESEGLNRPNETEG